jgi:hypothetical protein
MGVRFFYSPKIYPGTAGRCALTISGRTQTYSSCLNKLSLPAAAAAAAAAAVYFTDAS